MNSRGGLINFDKEIYKTFSACHREKERNAVPYTAACTQKEQVIISDDLNTYIILINREYKAI